VTPVFEGFDEARIDGDDERDEVRIRRRSPARPAHLRLELQTG